MNILEVNRNTLANLYEQYPESFNGLSMDDKYLIFNGESCDISNFNINDLLNGDTNFVASLSVLSPEDIFKIIRLHSLKINSDLVYDQKDKKETEKKIEIIKEENPLMKNISITRRVENGFEYEYFNIVDKDGNNHLFYNDRDVNIFDIYEYLKYRNIGRDITPDELIAEVERKLYEVRLSKARDISEKSNTTEDFANKMNVVNDPYKGEKNFDVIGNEEHDIAIISDLTDYSNNSVVTFNENEHGDLVVNKHSQNVQEQNSIDDELPKLKISETEDIHSDIEEKEEKPEEQVEAILIPTQEFYDLLNSNEELSEEQKRSVNLYYSYFGDLVLYEDYLLPELKDILNTFRAYVFDLKYGENAVQINQKQQEAVQKLEEIEMSEALEQVENYKQDKVDQNVKKLEKIMPINTYERNNNGSVSTLQVIAVIICVAMMLTAITLYLIG